MCVCVYLNTNKGNCLLSFAGLWEDVQKTQRTCSRVPFHGSNSFSSVSIHSYRSIYKGIHVFLEKHMEEYIIYIYSVENYLCFLMTSHIYSPTESLPQFILPFCLFSPNFSIFPGVCSYGQLLNLHEALGNSDIYEK